MAGLHRRAVALVISVPVALVALVAGGCSSGDDGDSSATTATATVDEVLAAASAAMADVATAHFTITRRGAEVFIDDGGQFRFDRAEGRYARPASADAVISVNAGGFGAEVAAVAIDGNVSITNPLTGAWEAAPAGFGFDPTILFAPDTGWRSLLAGGLTDAQLVDDGDPDRHHLRATVAAERVAVLTGGLVEEASTVELWIGRQDARVQELTFDVDVADGTSTWRLVLDGYGADVSITQPSLGSRP